MSIKLKLYEVLNLSSAATESEISRAYRRLALQYHPDRNPDGEEKFKELSTAYSVLSDPDKRMVYDRTGVIPGGADPVSDQQRSAEIGVEIRFFFETYASSEEEREDIIKSYEKSKGNFSKMVKELLLFDNSKEGEVQRLRTVVVQLLKDGKVKETPKWVETSSEKGIKKLEKSMAAEREEAEQQLKEMNLSSTAGDDGLGALAALIQARNKEAHSSMVDDLEARYCKPKSAKRGREDEKEGTKNKKRRN